MNSSIAGDRHVDQARAEVRLGDHEHRRAQRGDHHARSSCRDRAAAASGRPRSAASATISSTLPSSEAWKEKNGKLIARCAPLLACPSAEHRQDADDQQRDVDGVFVGAAGASSRGARAPPSRPARRRGRSPGGSSSSWGCRGSGCAWLPLSVTTEQTPRPITASVSSGSSGRRSGGARRRRPARSLASVGRLIGLSGLTASWRYRRRTSPARRTTREAIRRAIGAAVSAPKPPCSTVTAITIGRFGSPM